jgi:hypothetical protein
MHITDRMYIIVDSAQYNFNQLKNDKYIYWDYHKGMEKGIEILIFNPTTNYIYHTKVISTEIGAGITEDGTKTIVDGTIYIKGKYFNFVKMEILNNVKLTKEVYSQFNLRQSASKLLKLNNPKHHERLKLIRNACPENHALKDYLNGLIEGKKTKSGYTYILSEAPKTNPAYYKIGKSTKHPEEGIRATELSTGNPRRLVLEAFTTNIEDEPKFHQMFKDSRASYGGGTEWFEETEELLELIKKLKSP